MVLSVYDCSRQGVVISMDCLSMTVQGVGISMVLSVYDCSREYRG